MIPMISKDDAADKELYTKVYFRVKFETELLEDVVVVGSDTALGSWDEHAGHRLCTSEEHYPVWYSRKPVSLPLNKSVQYKYLAVGKNGYSTRWEELEGNRQITPTGGYMTVEDDGGLYRVITKSDESISADTNEELHSSNPSSNAAEARKRLDEILSKHAVEIDEHDSVITCSMELPIRVTRDSNNRFVVKTRRSSLLPALYSLQVETTRNTLFFGWPGIHLDTIEEKEELTALLREHYNCIPLFPPKETFLIYLEFCHNFLWPLFHNALMLDFGMLERLTSELWPAYKAINKFFADRISAYLHENDLIWVHDYQLLLLPMFLVRKTKRANVGLFLHIPFPSNELFRCIPMRDELLNGMLFADLIGFHIYEYANNFFVSCAYLSGYEQKSNAGGGLSLACDGHEVIIHVSHVHIQYDDVRKKVEESEEVKVLSEGLRSEVGNKFIFASVDRCEHLAGLMLKFKAFQLFLREYPNARGKVVLIQYAYPVMMWENRRNIHDELTALMESVNAEFGYVEGTTELVKHIYLHVKEVTWEEKYSLFQLADCLLDTSLRDGFNINPLEFICCHKDKPAGLILSEFIGCIRSLTCAYRCNPWDLSSTASILDKAWNMPFEELRGRFECDQTFLQRHSTYEWAEQFVKDLKRARKPAHMAYVMCGIGMTSRLVGTPVLFRELNTGEITVAVRQSRHRYFFFDYEGTLAYDRRRTNAIPSSDENLSSRGLQPLEKVKMVLRSLAEDSRNTVIILSGRDKYHLEKWFGDVEGLGLCAEHGYYYKVPAITNCEWHCVSKKVDLTWRDITLEILMLYVNKTQGSFIENKGSALVFQYRDADPEYGSMQAKELAATLRKILASYQVHVVRGKGYVEVRLSGINKGSAVLKILKQLTEQHGEADFILCIGDDRSDEDMFTVLNKQEEALFTRNELLSFDQSNTSGTPLHEGESGEFFDEAGRSAWIRHGSSPLNSTFLPTSVKRKVYTCTVGKKPSAARYFLNDTSDVFELLKAIEGTIKSEHFVRGFGNAFISSNQTARRQYSELNERSSKDPSMEHLFQSFSMRSVNDILDDSFVGGSKGSTGEVEDPSLSNNFDVSDYEP